MADEVDYESDSAMPMEEEMDDLVVADAAQHKRAGGRRVDASAAASALATAATATTTVTAAPSGRRVVRVVKGRGKRLGAMDSDHYRDGKRVFEKLRSAGDDSDSKRGDVTTVRSVDGWVVFVTGIHEEAQDEHLLDAFGDVAPVKNLHMNVDRRSGFVKGYALLEFEEYESAKEAIERLDGQEVLGQVIHVTWAFRQASTNQSRRSRGGRR